MEIRYKLLPKPAADTFSCKRPTVATMAADHDPLIARLWHDGALTEPRLTKGLQKHADAAIELMDAARLIMETIVHGQDIRANMLRLSRLHGRRRKLLPSSISASAHLRVRPPRAPMEATAGEKKSRLLISR